MTWLEWELVFYYPQTIATVFLIFLAKVKYPAKGLFFLRAMLALLVAVLLAHVNRIFQLWPADLGFFSGHTTFCLGLALSLGMLARWTLFITLPLVVCLAMGLVRYHFHTVQAVVWAVPITLVIYGLVHWLWKVPSRPLDSAPVSP